MATEKRLIDANKIAQDVRENNRENFTRKDWSSKQVCILLENALTVDAVEVVRCKECRYRSQYADENGMYHCGGINTTKDHALPVVAPDDFCSYGERKDHGTTQA